ncbi:glycan biosynthesis hexose transferase WsfD [Amycolatopsis sp. NPDC004368]
MRTRELRFGLAVFLASLTLLLVRFLVPRPIGMADNGDGWRLLCKLGGKQLDRPSEGFVRFSYGAGVPCTSDYVSSQSWLDWLAAKIGHVFGSDAILNLLILGVGTCVLIAIGITAAVLGLDLGRRGRIVATALLLLVMGDSAFFGYFASSLSEGAAFLGMLLIAGGLLLMHRRRELRYAGATVTVLGGLIGINAKSQTLLLIPVFVIAVLLVKPQGARGKARWALPLAVLVLVGGGTLAMQSQGDPANAEYREANMYNAIFDSIVDGKHDTNADLAALGLPPSFAKYIGTGWWSPGAAWTDPLYPQYRDKISRRNVLAYYESHPVRVTQILQQGGVNTLTARPDNLGSFGELSGQPRLSKEYRVPVFSGLAALAAPAGLFVLIPVWLLLAWAAIRAFRRKRREYGLVVLLLTVFAVGQLGLSALGEGVEGVKHQLLTLFPTVLAVAFGVLSLLSKAEEPLNPLEQAEPREDDEPLAEEIAAVA